MDAQAHIIVPGEAPPGRLLRADQRSRVWVSDLEGRRRLVHEDHDVLLEAPNWDTQGRLLLNGDGVLWDIPADGSAPPSPVPTEDLPAVNNDHVLSPDGTTVYASANDFHVYALPREGGVARRITSEDGRLHFLHGVSPDATTLSYIALERTGPDWSTWAPTAHVRLMSTDGTKDRRLTTDPGPDDGAEFSPDGRWVHYSTESFTQAPGHAQIARIPVGGGAAERLTHDARVDWFPHLSPDGRHAVYLSYPPGTTGHPEDLPVEVRVVDVEDWDAPLAVIALLGGQGTINVGSWSPDGSAFALVDYPID